MNATADLWASAWLVVVAAPVLLPGRLGGSRTAARLTAIDVLLLAIEEPALTLRLATADPAADRDGMASADVLDAALVSLAAAVALDYLALTGRRSTRRVLACGFLVALATAGLASTRGLPPGDAGAAGRHAFGRAPAAAGLIAWAAGLVTGRPARVPPSPDMPAEPSTATG